MERVASFLRCRSSEDRSFSNKPSHKPTHLQYDEVRSGRSSSGCRDAALVRGADAGYTLDALGGGNVLLNRRERPPACIHGARGAAVISNRIVWVMGVDGARERAGEPLVREGANASPV